MVAVAGAALLGGRLLLGAKADLDRGDLLIQRGEFGVRDLPERDFQFLLPGLESFLVVGQCAALAMRGGIGIVRTIRPVHSGEDGLKSVVILRRDGIELVIMAAGAVNGEALEGREGCHHHVVAVVVAGDKAVSLRDGQFDVPDKIPRAAGDEAQRDDAVRLLRVEHVSSKLFLDESRPGLVAVQRADDVIAIGPRGDAELVLVVAMRLAEVNDIEPVPRPAFAVTRAGKEAIHEMFDCRLLIADCQFQKGVHLVWRRRQAGEVKGDPADERGGISLGRWLKIFLCEFGPDEPIHRVGHRRGWTAERRHGGTCNRPESPANARGRQCFSGGVPPDDPERAQSQSHEDQP